MRTKAAAVALLLVLALAQRAGAAAKVKGASSYKPYAPIVLTAADVGKDAQFLWDVSGGAQVVESGATLYVWAPPGDYQVTLTAVDFTAKKIDRARFTFTVEGATPPVPPVPPVPPGPVPPTPTKTLRVLIVYDSAAVTAMPAAQQSVLFARAFRDLLNAKTPLGPDGKTHEWGIFDKGVDLSGYSKPLQALMARPRGSVPWIVLGGDAGVVYEGPLPPDVASATALVNKYAPAQRAYRKAA